MLNSKLLEKIRKVRGRLSFLVVGDLILDQYIEGDAERISPEAPVPVILEKKSWYVPGGAGNVAVNIARAGFEVTVCGVTGEDEEAEKLVNLLISEKVRVKNVTDPGRPTTLKTRITAKNQQLLRLDREIKREISGKTMRKFSELLEDTLSSKDFSAVIISDYAKGTVVRKIVDMLKNHTHSIFVDPKPENVNLFRGVKCIIPNLEEAVKAVSLKNLQGQGVQLAQKASEVLQGKLKVEEVVITMGEKGAFLRTRSRSVLIPARKRTVFDVTGAGDTFIAFYTLARASGISPVEACSFANTAGGITVEHYGPYAPDLREIEMDIMTRKILSES